jgi:hypothetical protein
MTKCVLTASAPSNSENQRQPIDVSQTKGAGTAASNVQWNVSFLWFPLTTCVSSHVAEKRVVPSKKLDGSVARVTVAPSAAWTPGADTNASVITAARKIKDFFTAEHPFRVRAGPEEHAGWRRRLRYCAADECCRVTSSIVEPGRIGSFTRSRGAQPFAQPFPAVPPSTCSTWPILLTAYARGATRFRQASLEDYLDRLAQLRARRILRRVRPSSSERARRFRERGPSAGPTSHHLRQPWW